MNENESEETERLQIKHAKMGIENSLLPLFVGIGTITTFDIAYQDFLNQLDQHDTTAQFPVKGIFLKFMDILEHTNVEEEEEELNDYPSE
jgi:hypothetical protein